MDIENKTVHIMTPLKMVYVRRVMIKELHIYLHSKLLLECSVSMLSNSKWNDNIYDWKKEYHTCVTKVTNNKYI